MKETEVSPPFSKFAFNESKIVFNYTQKSNQKNMKKSSHAHLEFGLQTWIKRHHVK